MREIPEQLFGRWRITETGTWVNKGLDDQGTALISFTGHDDRLRMHCLIAEIEVWPTDGGVSFSWHGSWEFDPMSGTGQAWVDGDGRLSGVIAINDSDDSTFTAERTNEPAEPIPDPPSYRDKWSRRRW